jgi:hypothetical protein
MAFLLYNFMLADTACKLILQESISMKNINSASIYSSMKRSEGLSVLSAAIFIAGEWLEVAFWHYCKP